MPNTAKFFPNFSAVVAGKTAWNSPGQTTANAWKNIKNGVLTPNDATEINCGVIDRWIDVKFDMSGAPAVMTEITEVTLSLRRKGTVGILTPGTKFHLYTDFPTDLARLVKTVDVDMDTAGAISNGSIEFAAISMTRDEFVNLRLRLESADGAAFGPPDLYEEP